MRLFVDYPSFLSPYVFKGLPIRWYSVMYLVGFLVAWLVVRQEKRKGMTRMTDDDIFNLFLLCIVFLLVGGRLGSVFIYDDARLYYLLHPWMIFWPFRGGRFVGLPGMSYHGSVAGVVAAILIFCRRSRRQARRRYEAVASTRGARQADRLVRAGRLDPPDGGHRFYEVTDILLPAVSLGYGFGRLGNFINAELYGRVTTSPIGMMFPNAERLSTSLPWVAEAASELGIPFESGGWVNLPRFPSQLFEMVFEGLVVFLILWFAVRPWAARRRPGSPGLVSAWYLILYGTFRFAIEYLREPDANMGYIISWGRTSGAIERFESFLNFTTGQLLCFLMVVWGIATIFITRPRKAPAGGENEDRREN